MAFYYISIHRELNTKFYGNIGIFTPLTFRNLKNVVATGAANDIALVFVRRRAGSGDPADPGPLPGAERAERAGQLRLIETSLPSLTLCTLLIVHPD